MRKIVSLRFSECFAGFEGSFCEKASCLFPDCSKNGVCIEGKCMCFHNYTGPDCGKALSIKSLEHTQTSLCSGRGEFDYSQKECLCLKGWLAPDCYQHENCLNRECTRCRNGWNGPRCGQQVPLECDYRCNAHGVCVNGSCTCSPGFQGRNCDISKFNARFFFY